MKRIDQIERRLRSLNALGEVVAAMKSLAAHHLREARAVVEPTRTYREGVERLLPADVTAEPEPGRPHGLVAIGAELGLCGAYNVRLVNEAVKRRAELGRGPTLCVGTRAARLLARREVKVRRIYPAPTGVRGITDLLLRLAEDVLAAYGNEGLASFEIVSSRFRGIGLDVPTSVRLLPMRRSQVVAAPCARYTSPPRFRDAVVRELLYVVLYDLFIDALAAEHAARLLATQSAGTWIDEGRERLRRQLAAARREASTQEIIEIAAGVRGRNRSAAKA